MNGIFFYIGLGLGLACACGLRPYLPALLAGALGRAGVLGVSFTGHFEFLQASWWLLAVTGTAPVKKVPGRRSCPLSSCPAPAR